MTDNGLGSLTGLSQDDIAEITRSKEFTVGETVFRIGNFSHHLRLKALEIIEDFGNSKRIAATLAAHGDNGLKHIFNQVTKDGMSLSKLPDFFDDNPELYLPLTLTVLHLYAAPFLKGLGVS